MKPETIVNKVMCRLLDWLFAFIVIYWLVGYFVFRPIAAKEECSIVQYSAGAKVNTWHGTEFQRDTNSVRFRDKETGKTIRVFGDLVVTWEGV